MYLQNGVSVLGWKLIKTGYFQVEFLADDVLATQAAGDQPAVLLQDGARISRHASLQHEFRAYVR